jgi:hypothetical protein
MNRSKLALAAAFISPALTIGIVQTVPAGAMPNTLTPVAQTAKADGLQLVRGRGGRGGGHGVRRFHGPRFHAHGPRHRHRLGAHRFWKPGNWCKNHPRRCFGGVYRPWRWCKNHPRRCAGYRYRGYIGAGGSLCHRHIYPVPGMGFHRAVRCNHRHYRAYDSWEWAY